MAQVLVTGGAGFIGSHLAAALLQRGDTVRIFDNFSSGSRENLAGMASKIEVIAGDLRVIEQVAQVVKGVDLVFHEAAFVSVPQSIENPADCYDTNINGTINLLEGARQAGCKRVVLASSAAVYGTSQELPLKERGETECLSPYAASKLFNETLAQLYTSSFALPVVALRYFNVFGPRQSPNSAYAAAIPKFIDAMRAGNAPTIFGDGSQTRDFVFVGDVIKANLLAAQTSQTGKVFNVCSGKESSLLDLLETLAAFFPSAPKPNFSASRLGDVPRSVGDPTLASKALDFRAQTSLADGLKQIVESIQ